MDFQTVIDTRIDFSPVGGYLRGGGSYQYAIMLCRPLTERIKDNYFDNLPTFSKPIESHIATQVSQNVTILHIWILY